MTPGKRVARLLKRYGSPVNIISAAQSSPTRAFVQPLRYKNKLYLGGSYLPSGYDDGGHCLYIGPPSIRLDRLPFDTLVSFDSRSYLIRRAEPVYLKEELLYVWAILQVCEGDSNEPV